MMYFVKVGGQPIYRKFPETKKTSESGLFLPLFQTTDAAQRYGDECAKLIGGGEEVTLHDVDVSAHGG